MTSDDPTLAGASDEGDAFAPTQAPAGEPDERLTKAIVRERLLGRPSDPVLIARFRVLKRLGSGGMGVVYAAYDPELDRKVALKLLLPDKDRPEARARLQREAQAMAQLSHPNVVTVHEVGAIADRVWLAMEYVEGQTLRSWSDARSRTWREVMDVMVAAGRGLQAAHEIQLIHRDFKPDNVMVGTDGRVRVMDFGLARTVATSGDPRVEGSGQPGATGSLGSDMTRTGSMIGTPAYMSPEQFRGEKVDATTDVFSFCVTFWELLQGQRPFAGTSLPELAAAVVDGKRNPAPKSARVPAWLTRALERGLHADVERRWATMALVLEELERGAARERRLKIGLGVGAAALAIAAVPAGQAIERAGTTADCQDRGREIEEAWSGSTRDRLAAALRHTGLSFADKTAERVATDLEVYATAWQHARTETCLDAEVRDTESPEIAERANWCLEQRRLDLHALIDQLAHPDADAVRRAVRAVAALPSIADCRDTRQLANAPTVPEHAREEVMAVRAALGRASALVRVGRANEAVAIATKALERAEHVAWLPLSANAHFFLGTAHKAAGEYERSELAFTRAYFDAAKSGGTVTAADAASVLVSVVGTERGRPEDAALWAGLADVEIQRLEREPGPRTAARLNNMALAERASGDYPRARELLEQSLAIKRAVLGIDHPDVAIGLHNLANVRRAEGAADEAKALLGEAREILEGSLGAEHPLAIATVSSLALAHYSTRDHEEARALSERVLSLRERAHGPTHPGVGIPLVTLAAIDHAAEQYDSARHRYQRALVIFERAYGPQHRRSVQPLIGLGQVALDDGRIAESIALLERALVLGGDSLDSSTLAEARFLLARGLVGEPGDRTRAVALARQAAQAYAARGDAKADELEAVTRWLAEHEGRSP